MKVRLLFVPFFSVRRLTLTMWRDMGLVWFGSSMLQQHDETDTPKWNESGVPHFFSAETKFWWTYTKCHSAFGGTDRLDRAEPSVRGSSGVLRVLLRR